MPHFKADIIDAVARINQQVNQPARLAKNIKSCKSLSQLCASAKMTKKASNTISLIQPELQDVIFSALQTSSKGKRGAYVTWRAGLDQKVTISVPRAPGLPTCIEFTSGFNEDSLVRELG